ncbi:MAG: SDR family NAD(P)-dependent oxidoreductase, partial [candidate division Zixibacteria bacterium]|nr:SDR family NAD(P)-dependent oxidoreductase [candidate division Zixibacteria bacterium]
MLEDKTLSDKIVLITGASAGIGRATARAFAAEGARLILIARRTGRLSALSEELAQAHGTDCHILTLDLKDQSAITARLGSLPKEWLEIDVLVNNAGLARGVDKLYEMKAADWNEVIDVNVKALIA